MEDNKLYLGIDYGGNTIKAGLVDASGQLSGKTSWPTEDLRDKVACRSFATKVSDFVHGMGVYTSELGGIGLAIPGMLSPEGFVTPNVRVAWPLLITCLEQMFAKLPVKSVNDANAAALGEIWLGAGSNAHSALLVTLGSGLGSGLIVDGNVVVGAHGAAGEVGHMTVVPDGRPCKCGRRGCVERYASARGIVQTFLEAQDENPAGAVLADIVPESETDARAVFEAFRVGDVRARRALSVMAEKLGFALAQVACVADPDVILLGGGMAAGVDLFIDDLRDAFGRFCLPSCSSTEIRAADLAGDAGIYGAARYAMTSSPLDASQRDWLDPDFGL